MTITDEELRAPRAGLWHRLYHGETRYDFVGRRWVGFTLSLVLLVISVFSLAVRDLNMGIDFEGGVSWEVPAGEVSTEDVEAVLADHDLEAERIQTLGGAGGDRLRAQVGPQDPDVQAAVRQALAERAGVPLQDVSLNAVGPSWGDEITRKAVRALVVFLILIALYLTIRLEWRMAIAALAAVAHDVVITVGIYSVFQWEVTPATVIAVLTILGFSLYDTIVVFDKVQENVKRYGPSGKLTIGDIVNLAMNQVLMRSLNTSVAAVLPVLSLLVVGSWMMGAVALEEFAVALFVGIVVGAYSSIFVATPIVEILKRREPRWRQAEERLGARVTSASTTFGPSPLAAAAPVVPVSRRGAAAAGGARPASPSAGPSRPQGDVVIPPRPRKKKRR